MLSLSELKWTFISWMLSVSTTQLSAVLFLKVGDDEGLCVKPGACGVGLVCASRHAFPTVHTQVWQGCRVADGCVYVHIPSWSHCGNDTDICGMLLGRCCDWEMGRPYWREEGYSRDAAESQKQATHTHTQTSDSFCLKTATLRDWFGWTFSPKYSKANKPAWLIPLVTALQTTFRRAGILSVTQNPVCRRIPGIQGWHKHALFLLRAISSERMPFPAFCVCFWLH